MSKFQGAMFGEGIYFADMFSKSIQYSYQSRSLYSNFAGTRNRYNSSRQRDAFSLALLCEVALGKECVMTDCYAGNFDKDEHMSIKGVGQNSPDPINAVYDERGVLIPMGPLEYLEQYNDRYIFLNHNEYIVQSEAQVRTRYLVLVRNLDYCALCETETSYGNKKLCEYKLDHVSYDGLGSVEQNFVKFALTLSGRKPQDVYDSQLDAFCQSRQDIAQMWSPLVPLSRDSKVCSSCFQHIASMILSKHAQRYLPAAISSRRVCSYGYECKNKDDLEHGKKYQHWFHPNTRKDEDEDNSDDEDTYNQ